MEPRRFDDGERDWVDEDPIDRYGAFRLPNDVLVIYDTERTTCWLQSSDGVDLDEMV